MRWGVCVGWQAMSVLLAGTGVFAQLLVQNGMPTPMLQMFAVYISLAAVFVPLHALRRRSAENTASVSMSMPSQLGQFLRSRNLVRSADVVEKWPWVLMILVSVFDVQGNVLIVVAYQSTTVASVQLLDCFSIVVVVLFSKRLWGNNHSITHALAIVACLIGVLLLVVGDAQHVGPSQLTGDLLVVAGASLYGLNNVLQELAVKLGSRTEYLARLGVYGALLSGGQSMLFERHAIAAVPWNENIFVYYFGFTSCMFALYAAVAPLLAMSSSVVMNLNFLSADFYALIAASLVFSQRFRWFYFVAFSLIVGGLSVYYLAPPPRIRYEFPIEADTKSWQQVNCALVDEVEQDAENG